MQPQNQNTFGPRDIDPGRWRPLYYGLTVDVGVALGALAQGSVSLNAQPYILMSIQAKIIGETSDPATTGLYQDGQFSMEWRDEQTNYQSGGFIPADLMWGGVHAGFYIPLSCPIPYQANHTLTFRVRNDVARVLASQAEFYSIGISLHGIGDYGDLSYQKR